MQTTTTSKDFQLITFKRTIILSVIVCLFFSLVAPSAGNSLVIVVGMVMLAIGVYVWCAVVVRLIALLLTPRFTPRSQKAGAICVSACVVFLIILQSIGQLSWRDALATSLLTLILYLYTSYRASQRSGSGV